MTFNMCGREAELRTMVQAGTLGKGGASVAAAPLEASLLALVVGGLGREEILSSVRHGKQSNFEQAMQHKVVDIWALEMALRSLISRIHDQGEPALHAAAIRLGKRLLELVSSTLIHFGLDSALPISGAARELAAAERSFAPAS